MGQTPLSFAAENGHVAVVKLLPHTGIVNVDSRDIYDQTPLMKVAQRGHEAVVKLLLEYGADLQSKDNNFGWTPLF
jgi:ankyrin repeat protein